MRNRIYEVDSDGLLHDDVEESEDVLDLDESHVMNFVDINHEYIEATSRRHEGRGFYEELEDMLDTYEDLDSDTDLDALADKALAELEAADES